VATPGLGATIVNVFVAEPVTRGTPGVLVTVKVYGAVPVNVHTMSGAGLPPQTAPPPVGLAAAGSGLTVTTRGSERGLEQFDGAGPKT